MNLEVKKIEIQDNELHAISDEISKHNNSLVQYHNLLLLDDIIMRLSPFLNGYNSFQLPLTRSSNMILYKMLL